MKQASGTQSDQIIEHATVRVDGLHAHPRNYNRHPDSQIQALRKSLRTFGQVRSIVVQRNGDGHLIVAGEGIATAARLEGIETLWADVIPADWPPQRVTAYLAADNELARESEPELEQLEALAVDVAQFDETLAALALGLGEVPGIEETPTAPADPRQVERWQVPDALWPSDNDWGVPLLDVNHMATAVELPVEAWGRGSGARTKQTRGTWHFYTEDYRFQALWDDPSPVVRSGCAAVVEPNFSCYTDMPPAVALWRIYQKRWLARYWQSFGIKVFADLNVAEPHYALNLLGIPKGWTAWATRGYTERMASTVKEWEMACEHAGTDNICYWVYGGGKQVQKLCRERGWVHILEQRDEVRDG